MGTYLSAQQIHKCIVTLTLSLFVGFGFILQLNVPAARSEEYTTQISRRPNILFVMTDDQPIKDTMIAMPEIRERVRDRGMTLPNAYVSESLCCPSRASILRAQYPHNTGVMRNGPPDGGVQIFHAFEGIGLRMPLGSRLLELVVNKSSLQNPRERMLRLAVWERNWYRKSCGKRSSLSCPPNRRNRRAADLASTTGPRWPASSSSSRAASPGRCSRRRWAAGRAARAGGGCATGKRGRCVAPVAPGLARPSGRCRPHRLVEGVS
jgi:hypothetical protein